MTAAWYAIHVKPHKERYVYERLVTPEGLPQFLKIDPAEADLEAFFPAVRVKPKNPRAAKIRPYFPGYLFVHVDLEVLGDRAFDWIPGAHGLVHFGDTPVAVPDSLINELRQRVARINEAGGIIVGELKPGDRVRITGGPFAGYEAIFDAQLPGKERVQVLLSFLSRHPQRLQLEAEDLEKVKKT